MKDLTTMQRGRAITLGVILGTLLAVMIIMIITGYVPWSGLARNHEHNRIFSLLFGIATGVLLAILVEWFWVMRGER